MNQSSLKLGMNRLYLIFFMLLCSVYINENVFSQLQWHRENMLLTYDKKDNSITFDFLFYDYKSDQFNMHSYLKDCYFLYSEDGKKFIHLMKISTKEQDHDDLTWITMKDKKKGEHIQLLDCYKLGKAMNWPDNGKDLKVQVHIENKLQRFEQSYEITKRAIMSVKWLVGPIYKQIKYVKIKGSWKIRGRLLSHKIKDVYRIDIWRSNINSLKNDFSGLKSGISNRVNIIAETDAISITGTDSCENIKVYTVSGVEVKSVVAADDVVNIKLAKNQIYLVKAGKARYYKVAL